MLDVSKELNKTGFVNRFVGKFLPNIYEFENVEEFLKKRQFVSPTPSERYLPGVALKDYVMSILADSVTYNYRGAELGNLRNDSGSLEVKLGVLDDRPFPVLGPYKRGKLKNGLVISHSILIYKPTSLDKIWLAGFKTSDVDMDKGDGDDNHGNGNRVRVYDLLKPALA